MFDAILQENQTQYGIIKGNDRLFYIKVGNGENLYGKENKYLQIAEQIHLTHHVSVLVADNPIHIAVKDAMHFDSAFIDKHFPSIREIYAFGHSKGGQMLVSYAYLCPKIQKVLSVNAPLMINLHKTKEGILRFDGEYITMVYGEKDPSFRYVEILNPHRCPKFGYVTVKAADHDFSNMLDTFLSLPERHLF